MTLEDNVHAFRLPLFRRAQELGNVSAACRELGVSRSLYYQLRQRFTRYGAAGLHPTRRRGGAQSGSGWRRPARRWLNRAAASHDGSSASCPSP